MLKKIAFGALTLGAFVPGGKMKKALLFAVCLAVLGSLGLQASLITIINPGFESDVLAPGVGTFNTFAAGWACASGNCGAFHPQAAQFPGLAPEGVNTAYANAGTISQTLVATLQLNTTYTLMVDVGKRLDFQNFPGYTVQLLAGSTVIASESSLNPGAGTFGVSISTYGSGAVNALAGQALTIKLISSGPQTNFDAVTLDGSATGIPEPSTIGLMVGGLPLLLFLRRRRNLNK